MKLVRGGWYLAVKLQKGKGKSLPFFGVNRVTRTYVLDVLVIRVFAKIFPEGKIWLLPTLRFYTCDG